MIVDPQHEQHGKRFRARVLDDERAYGAVEYDDPGREWVIRVSALETYPHFLERRLVEIEREIETLVETHARLLAEAQVVLTER